MPMTQWISICSSKVSFSSSSYYPYLKYCFSGLYFQLISPLTLHTFLSWSQLLPASLYPRGQIWVPDMHIEGFCGHYFISFQTWISKLELSTLRASRSLPCPKFYQQVPPAPQNLNPENYRTSFFPLAPWYLRNHHVLVVSILSITHHCPSLSTPATNLVQPLLLPALCPWTVLQESQTLCSWAIDCLLSHHWTFVHGIPHTWNTLSMVIYMASDILLHKPQLKFSSLWSVLSRSWVNLGVRYNGPLPSDLDLH